MKQLTTRSSWTWVYFTLGKRLTHAVSHNELLDKLWKMGITGHLWSWFKSYLQSRTYFVSFENISSDTLPVISGVPQGSILGPLLFIVYVSDMPQAISNSHCFSFADDVKLLKVINSSADHDELQEDLMAVSKWCDHWNLTLNSSKCVALQFSSQPQVINSNAILHWGDQYSIFGNSV